MDRLNSVGAKLNAQTLGVALTALTLLFGGAGQATTAIGPMPSSTTTTIAADTDDGDSDTGLWGLAGLLGLLGLAGLKRRNDRDVTSGTAAGGPSAPRV